MLIGVVSVCLAAFCARGDTVTVAGICVLLVLRVFVVANRLARSAARDGAPAAVAVITSKFLLPMDLFT